ncbi:nucleoporin GLE1 isoform X2 [Copidosoma floridanum]|uniref:nucleoporin GLE1 isoform X2 n=1 Tax=Copidosoma floridanum TaxID=29053 RepID=UPI0006C9CCAF|nr:nucleoporin GLE1 isoform X2 [Copidosoma floridanum]
MSSKDLRDHLRRKVMIEKKSSLNETFNSLSIGEIIHDPELKTSILSKAARVSGEFDKVTIGPRANFAYENTLNTPSENEISDKNSSKNHKSFSSSRSNLTFSIKKILLENELLRKEKVKQAVDKKKKEMEQSQRQLQEELSDMLARVLIQKEKENEEKLIQLEAEEEQLAFQLEQDRKKELERRKMKESEDILKKILPFKESFQAKWKDITKIYSGCRDQNSACRLLNSYTHRIKELSSRWEPILEKAKTGDLTQVDLRMVELIVQSNAQLYESFKADIEQIEIAYDKEITRREAEVKQAKLRLQEEEAQKQKQIQEAEYAAKAEQANALVEQQKVEHSNQHISEVDGAPQPPPYPNTPEAASANAVVTQVTTGESSDYPDVESYLLYMGSQVFLKNYEASYQDFIHNNAMKAFKSECRKTLNITINSISHLNREQLMDKYDKLRLFLSGKGSPNILLNPQAEAYSKYLLAQKILDQGDITISSKPELAFPFAAIVVALWNDWPDFGEILLALFRTVSPFFAPVFLSRRNDQTEEEYYKSLGCKYGEDGKPEQPDKFWKRLGGIMYLYASILVTRQRQGVNKPHPHGLGNAWRWLAATLNFEPKNDIADICATLIYIMLEVTGNDMLKTYPNQFPKLLLILNNVYYEKLKNVDPVLSAPISRLGDFLATALKKGSIPPPKGQLPYNFW